MTLIADIEPHRDAGAPAGTRGAGSPRRRRRSGACIDGSGRVIGHIQALAEAAGVRYRARRFHARSRAFRDLGEFWSAGDAIDCLRFAR